MGKARNKSWIEELQATVTELGKQLDYIFPMNGDEAVEVSTEDGIRVFTHDGFSFREYEVSEDGDLTISQGGYDSPRRQSTRHRFRPETVAKAKDFIKRCWRSMSET